MKKYLFICFSEAYIKNLGKYQNGSRKGEYYIQLFDKNKTHTYTIPLEFIRAKNGCIGMVVSQDYIFRVYNIAEKKNIEMSTSIFINSFNLLSNELGEE